MTLASVLLARGRPVEALAAATETMALLAELGKSEEGEALTRAAHAEVLWATGAHDAARAALAPAARIKEPRQRDRFLRNRH